MDCKHQLELLNDELQRPGSPASEVQERWGGMKHTTRVNGVWRIEGYITFLLHQYELLRTVDPALPPTPPPHCLNPRDVAQFFNIPPVELGLVGLKGKPGRRRSTDDIADFVHARFPRMTYKEIYTAWKAVHPNDQRVTSWEMMRAAYRRKYRGKDRPRKRNTSTA